MALIEVIFALPVTAAVIGLVGGFLLAWAANNFARKREEYSYRLEAYSELLASIEEYTEAKSQFGISQRFDNACAAMNLAISRIDLLAPRSIYEVAQYSEELAKLDRKSPCRNEWLNFLTSQMRENIESTLRWHLLKQLRRSLSRRKLSDSYQTVDASDIARSNQLPDCIQRSSSPHHHWDP